MQTNSSPSVQQSYFLSNDQEVMEYVLARPSLFIQIFQRFRAMHRFNTRPPVQQQPVTTMNVQQYPTTFITASQPNHSNSYTDVSTESTDEMSHSLFGSSENFE